MHIPPRIRRRLTILSTILLLVIVLYYFGSCVLDKKPDRISSQLIPVEAAPEPDEDQTEVIRSTIQPSQTIMDVLQNNGIDNRTAYRLVDQSKSVYDLKRIIAGNAFSLTLENGVLKTLRYDIDTNSYLQVIREGGDSFSAEIVNIPYQVKTELITGSIEVSLYQAILSAGEKAELADFFADLYEFDIDFNRDIRKGDSFKILVEKKYLNAKLVTYGPIQAAEFINRGKATVIVRYTDPEGNTSIFHPDGRSVKKMFLRSPLPFLRVTSSFGRRRHPVMGYSSQHQGIDLGAPSGTRVRSTGAGVITAAAYNNIRGRYITIRHPNQYVTHYYHLSRFQGGIRRGKRVNQGETIGYVGSSGRTTGPHLHYGFQRNNRYINPLRLKSPPIRPVQKKYLDHFQLYQQRLQLLISIFNRIPLPRGIVEYIKRGGDQGIPGN